ncbi:hypothetical protein [Halarcobacter anaerophilus]|uniref:hypothetical protein n=1 Tax=Halarcobacter anaerophilus TaxID=877500 RepID=UPI0005CAB9FE|nr:hypothetical protein [Halarcobacter anaerophilus]
MERLGAHHQAKGLEELMRRQGGIEVMFDGNVNEKLRTALEILDEIDEDEDVSTALVLTSLKTAKKALNQAIKRT